MVVYSSSQNYSEHFMLKINKMLPTFPEVEVFISGSVYELWHIDLSKLNTIINKYKKQKSLLIYWTYNILTVHNQMLQHIRAIEKEKCIWW